MLTLLDTHAWVWWVTGDRRLSKPARRAIERGGSAGTLAISLTSAWEVAKKVQKAQLVLDRPVGDWIDQAIAQPNLQVIELTRPIFLESSRLPGSFHGDPADQIIVATAREREAVVVTKDEGIREYAHVRSIW
jgi:PIN domain nuclease of toxin-antitoxin system